jgi:hypothetical protein
MRTWERVNDKSFYIGMLLLQFGLCVGMVNGNAITNTVSRRQQGVMLKLTALMVQMSNSVVCIS